MCWAEGKSAVKGLTEVFNITQRGGCAFTPCLAEMLPPDPTGDGIGDVGTNCPILQLCFDKSLPFLKEGALALSHYGQSRGYALVVLTHLKKKTHHHSRCG